MGFKNFLSDAFSHFHPNGGDDASESNEGGYNQSRKRKPINKPAVAPELKQNPVLPTARPVGVDQMMMTAQVPSMPSKSIEEQLGTPPDAPALPSAYEKHTAEMNSEIAGVKKPSLGKRILRGALMGGGAGGVFGAIGGAVAGGADPNDTFQRIDRDRVRQRYDPILSQDLKSEQIRDKRSDDLRADQNFTLHQQDVNSAIANRDADNKRATGADKRAAEAADMAKYQRGGDDTGQFLYNLKNPNAPVIPLNRSAGQPVGPARVPNILSPNVQGEISQAEAEGNEPAFDSVKALDEEVMALAQSTFKKIYEKDPQRAIGMVQRDPSMLSYAKTRVGQRQATHNETRRSNVSRAKAKGMQGAVRGRNSNVGTVSDYQTQLNRLKTQ